jgi:hypothetical protein
MKRTEDAMMQLREQEQSETTETQTGVTFSPKSILNLTAEGISEKAKQIVDYYTDGYNNPAEGLILAKKLADMSEQIKNNLQDSANNELKLGKGDKANLFGCVINSQMVGVKYSFKECGDPVWNELKEKITNREAFLKTIKGSKSELIEETGEVVTIYEPVKSGKMAPVIKIL